MLVVEQAQAIALKLNNPARVLECIPSARMLPDREGIVVLPHKPDEVRVLRNLGIKAPAPILHYYDFPGNFTPYNHQRMTSAFLTMNKKALVLNEIGCVDADTEYLSPTGWKRIADYSGGAVAQYHPETGCTTFVASPEFVKLPCADMVRFKTAYGVDQLLSPEHRVLYTGSTGKQAVCSAEHVLERHTESKLGWKGRITTTFSPASRVGISLTDAELRLMVAVMADGHFASGTNWCVVRLKKEHKKARLRKLLIAASVQYTEFMPEYKSALGFSVFRFTAPRRDKTYGTWAWDATSDQLLNIADEVWRWDGSARKAGAVEFFSRDKSSADFVQYAFAATGRTASLNVAERDDGTDYVVHARKSASLLYVCGSSRGEKTETIYAAPSTDGFKYCFMVPSTFLILRRNGCIFATGNTGKTQSALWAADYLMKQGLVKRVLILSPLSTLERVWGDAVFKEFYHRKAVVMHGTAKRRRRLLNTEADFYIINHDGFSIISDECMGMFDIVIVDEAAVYRNPSTAKFRRLRAWMNGNPHARLWMMTGTPTPNSPTDAWALAQLTGNPDVARTFTAFRDQTMERFGQYTYFPRPTALATVQHVLQPAVRYTRDECLDLPDTVFQTREVPLTAEQKMHYDKMMKHFITDVAGGEQITAVNEAVKLQKLVQIACIKHDTDVLTDRGWMPVQKVNKHHMVWDGTEWVQQGGAVYKGERPIVVLDGVCMTPDHKVWVGRWVAAQELIDDGGFNRPEVRLPNSFTSGTTHCNKDENGALDMPLRLREYGVTAEPVPAQSGSDISAQLWMLPRQSDTQHDQHPPLSRLDRFAGAVLKYKKQGLGQLRGAGYRCMSGVGAVLRSLLGGYGADLPAYAYTGSEGQQWPILAGELSLGERSSASEQPPQQLTTSYPTRNHGRSASSQSIRDKARDTLCEDTQVQVASIESTHKVYDLINCGPRNRFVVRGTSGELLIVHNCGVAYNDMGENVELDCKPRVNAVCEIVEEVGEKVIIFVPLTGTLHMLERELSKRWTVGVVNGAVSTSKRNRIFENFQTAVDPRIILAHPATMAHGLTLTAASTIIWYGPITSNEQYTQANGRIERIGKRHVSNVIHIEGTPLERKMYTRLQNKQKLQGLLLDLIQNETEN